MEPLYFVGLAFWVAMFFAGMFIARNRRENRERLEKQAFKAGQNNVLDSIRSLQQAIGMYSTDAEIEHAVLDFLHMSVSHQKGMPFHELLLKTSEIKSLREAQLRALLKEGLEKAAKQQPLYTETKTVTKTKKHKAKRGVK